MKTLTLIGMLAAGPAMLTAASSANPFPPETVATEKTAKETAPLATTGTELPKDFIWKGVIAAGKTLEIKGVNGSVQATLAPGKEAQVFATRRADKSDPESVKIEVVEHKGGVTICAVYPTSKRGKPNRCVPGRGGRMDTHDNDVTVEFTVQVPRGVNLVERTVNGDVRAKDLTGNVQASTVNGAVNITTTGSAEASTVNGSIGVSLGQADWKGKLAYSTVNGSITVELPANASARVTAKTVNGDLTSDFPMTVSGKFSNRHMRGTIGKGGRVLSLSTVNGSITLRRRG